MKRYALCVLHLAIAPFVMGQIAGGTVPFAELQVPRGLPLRTALDAEPNLVNAAEMLLTAVLTKCGDSEFFLAQDKGAYGSTRLYQFKAPFVGKVTLIQMSQADRMNGREAEGSYQFYSPVYRWIEARPRRAPGAPAAQPQWSQWQDAEGLLTLHALRIALERRAGHWKITAAIGGESGVDNVSDEAIRNKLTCDAALSPNPFGAPQIDAPTRRGIMTSGTEGDHVADEEIVTVDARGQAAKLVKGATPAFPAYANKVAGIITLKVIIDTTGKVQDVKYVRGRPGLFYAAEAAVRQWEYRPTIVNGKPVSVVTTIDIEFKP